MTHTPAPGESAATVLERISDQFADISHRFTAISDDMTALRGVLDTTDTPPASATQAHPATQAPRYTQAPQFTPPPPAAPAPPFVAPGHPIAPPVTPPPVTPHLIPPRLIPPGPTMRPVSPYPMPPVAPRPYAPYPTHRVRPSAAPKRSVSDRISSAAERGLIGKLLAGAGVAITLVGVVLLLVLAAQAGLLRPELRVAGGAMLAAILVGVGVWIGRDAGKRSGASALVATGIAAALFDALAITTIYHWAPDYVSLILAAAIAAGGLGVARWWDSQTLALMVGVPVLVFAPIITGGVDAVLVGFMLCVAASALWIQLGRNWTALFAVNTAATTVPLLFVIADGHHYRTDDIRWFFVLALMLNVLLALGSTLALLGSSSRPLLITLIAMASVVPMLGAEYLAGDVVAAMMLAATALTVIVLTFVSGTVRGVTHAVRTVWLTSASVTAAAALIAILDGRGILIGLAGIGLVVAVAACVTTEFALPMRIIATVFTAVALFASLPFGALNRLLVNSSLTVTEQAQLVIVAAVSLAAVAVLTWSWSQNRPEAELHTIGTVGALISLGLVTEICVGLGGALSGGSDSGFRAGHAVATIVWVATAAAGLVWARHRSGPVRTLTVTVSLAVIAAAVAKLFLFDLAALDGLFRVIAFIVVGLLLLSLGVVYAQSLNSTDGRRTAAHT
ncbi:DUF2339 domain-containing protein [Gordonia sp. DT219]|uniref:DUF2339 domain-containing protein n=1 Tax=Gordonia sp. DT219 TaxID=3416658 RepID=UPI003CF313D7